MRDRRKPTVQPHNFVVIVVSLSLGSVAVFGLLGILVLTFYERPIDAAVATMVGGAIGSLGTLLTNVRNHQDGQQGSTLTGDVNMEGGGDVGKDGG